MMVVMMAVVRKQSGQESGDPSLYAVQFLFWESDDLFIYGNGANALHARAVPKKHEACV